MVTEAEALQNIANAINHLANTLGTYLFLFLLFKNMGTSSDIADKIKTVFEKK